MRRRGSAAGGLLRGPNFFSAPWEEGREERAGGTAAVGFAVEAFPNGLCTNRLLWSQTRFRVIDLREKRRGESVILYTNERN